MIHNSSTWNIGDGTIYIFALVNDILVLYMKYYTLRVEHSYQGARLLVYQKVYDFIHIGSWCFSSRISNFHFGLINDKKRVVIPINTFKDELVLGNSIFGDLSFKEAYFTRSNVPQPTN